MKKTVFLILCALSITVSNAFSQAQILDNRDTTLAPPTRINLYYDNREETGYMFWVNREPFLLIDSVKNLFNFNDFLESSGGSYLVNGRGVDTYYYGNNLYIDMNDFCNAYGVSPRQTDKGVVFISLHETDHAVPRLNNPSISIILKGTTNGVNSDPVNNVSHTFTVSLTNQTESIIPLNHFNFILLAQSGNRYVSIKDMGYGVVWGGNDTPDTIMLDPHQEHTVNLTFDLTADDSPRTLMIIQNQTILGTSGIQ